MLAISGVLLEGLQGVRIEVALGRWIAVPIMRAQGGGTIVNVSSGTSRMVLPGVGAYAATKAALNMLSLVAREEFAPDGIVVSLVYPSVTATEFQDKLRAGAMGVGGGGRTLHTPRYVAKAMVRAIRTGEAEVVIPTVLSARRRWRYPTCRDDRAISPNPIYEASCYRT